MIQDVFIIGATGRVGRTLVEQIINKRDADASLHANPTRIVGLASSSNMICSFHGLSPKDALEFANGKCKNTTSYNSFADILKIARDNHKKNESALVFVDATSLNELMAEFHLDVIKNT